MKWRCYDWSWQGPFHVGWLRYSAPIKCFSIGWFNLWFKQVPGSITEFLRRYKKP